ncbi:25743_t:CDS:10, partial [Gigaspora rosea]
MDKSTHRYGTSRKATQKVAQKVKPPTTSKLKPSKHSASPLNKINCEPNPPSNPSIRSNVNISSIHGQSLSGDSGDSKIVENQTVIESYVTALPKLSQKKTTKKKLVSRNNFTNVKTKNVNESSFDNIEQVDEDDGVVVVITNKSSTIPSNRISIQPSTIPSNRISIQPSTIPSNRLSIQPSTIPSNRLSIQSRNSVKRQSTFASIPKRTSSIPNTDDKTHEKSSVSPSTIKSSVDNVNSVHRPLEKINDSDSSKRSSRITPKKSISNSSTNKSLVRNVKSQLYNNVQISKKSPPISPIITPKRDNVKSLSSVSSSILIQNKKNSHLKKSPPISPIITPKRDSAKSLSSVSSSALIHNRNSHLKKSPPISPNIKPKKDNTESLLSVPSSTSIQNRNSYLKKRSPTSPIIILKKRDNSENLFSVPSSTLIQNRSSYLNKIPPPVTIPSSDSVESSLSVSPSTLIIHSKDSSTKIHPPSSLSKVAFTQSDINHIRSKSEPLPQTSSNELSSVEEDDLKRRKTLWNVIKELIETEKTFLQDMKLLEEFSKDFLDLLLVASGIENSSDDYEKHCKLENDETFIGDVFAQMMRKEQVDSRLEKVYGEYCKRHEAAVQKLREFDDNETVQGFLQKCKLQCNGRTTSWDITSLLIKPVQRVLKYPLLLQQILSLTKPSHPDYEQLQFSLSEITKVAERINEIKKRKDIVEKIVGNKKHSYKRNDTKAAEDELYNAFVEKFKYLEERGIQLEKEVRSWVKYIKLFFEDQRRLATALEDFHTLGISSNKNIEELVRIIEYGKAIKGLESSCGKEMEDAIKKVLFPLIEKFLSLFKAPAAVMKKRERKLFDYCHVNILKAKGETPEKSLQQSADAFVFISEQLREELPTFFIFMTEYYDIIVQELVKIQSRFYRQMSMDFQQYFYKFVDLHAVEQISDDRELVLRDIDVIKEYNDYYYNTLKIDEVVNEFVLIDTKNLDDYEHRNGRESNIPESIRSSISSRRLESSLNKEESKEHRKGGIWTDEDTDGLSWYSNNSFDNKIRNLYELEREIKHKSQPQESDYKKYSTDSIIEYRSSYIGGTFQDSLNSLIGDEKNESPITV